MAMGKDHDFSAEKLDSFLKSRGLADLGSLSSLKSSPDVATSVDSVGNLEYQNLRKSAKDEVELNVFHFLRYKKIDAGVNKLSSEDKKKLLSKIERKASSVMLFLSAKRQLSFDKMFVDGFAIVADRKKKISSGKEKPRISKTEIAHLEAFLRHSRLISRGDLLKSEDLLGEIHFAEEMLFILKHISDDIKKSF